MKNEIECSDMEEVKKKGMKLKKMKADMIKMTPMSLSLSNPIPQTLGARRKFRYIQRALHVTVF